MRFGKSAKEAAEEPSRGGGGGDWIKYLRDGDTTFRIMQEPDEWTYYWEHFSPAGFSFPCPRQYEDPTDMCPGCSSDNEKMKKVNRKIAFNVLESYQGQDYVNAYKVGPTVADKLENRFKRFATVTDRDYTITKFKTSSDRWDFDVEGSTPSPVDPSKYDMKDIESMLAQSYEEAWGDPQQAEANRQASETAQPAAKKKATIAPVVKSEDPPFEPKVYQEADLRKMDREDLLMMIKSDLELTAPETLTTTDQVVDWLMEIQN